MAKAAQSNILRAAREKLGLSQGAVAEKLGITAAAVGHYESGIAKPPLERAQKLARVLKIDVAKIQLSDRAMRGSRKKQASALGDRALSAVEREVIEAMRAMPLAKRRPAITMLLAYAKEVNG